MKHFRVINQILVQTHETTMHARASSLSRAGSPESRRRAAAEQAAVASTRYGSERWRLAASTKCWRRFASPESKSRAAPKI
eukprot:SAG11_NODE_29289_length_312_cov_1.122066_1_plen_80_part_01